MTLRALVLALSLVASVAAQATSTDLTAVKALYGAADYEGALRLLATADAGDDDVQVEQYRALCLLALGRTTEAHRSVEQIFARQPLYAVDVAEVSPRMVSLVAEVRQRLLPVLARNLYGLAQRNIENREYAAGVAQLTEMLAVVDAAGPEAGLDDLRSLGAVSLELARKQLAATGGPAGPSTPTTLAGPANGGAPVFPTVVYSDFLKLAEGQTSAARTPVPVSATAAELDRPLFVRPDIYSEADRIQPPVPILREVPRWIPPDEAARRATHSGQVELVIDERGGVEAASIVQSVHAAYDAALLEAVRKWRYRPATRSGQPVRYRLKTPVVLRPPNP